MTASIDVISKKDVIVVLYVLFLTVLMWCSVELEKTHQVCKLAMNVAEYLERGLGG